MATFKEAKMLPIENPACGDSECENHLHTTTTAIIVIDMETLQTPELDVDTARKAYNHLSQTAFFSLTAGGEGIGGALFLFIDEENTMSEEVVDALSDYHNVYVSTDRAVTKSLLSTWTDVRGKDYKVAVFLSDDRDNIMDSPSYQMLRQAENVRTIHSLAYAPPCPHLGPVSNAARLQVCSLVPTIYYIKRKYLESFVSWTLNRPAATTEAK